MKHTNYYLVLLFLTIAGPLSATYFGNGLKIGEVDQDSAIIWTRLTRDAEFNMQGHMWIDYEIPSERTDSSGRSRVEHASRMPNGATLNDMAFSLPGAAGEVRLIYWPDNDTSKIVEKDWIQVDVNKDHTLQILIDGLKPNTEYDVVLASRNLAGSLRASVTGQFKTAPKSNTVEEVIFTVVTCHDFGRRDDLINGHRIYPSMARIVKPDFMVHAGDIEYYDKADPWARSAELARHKWNRIFALPYQVDFYRQFASYFIKDDHDTLKNDAWPGESYGDLTWEQGLAIYREQVPIGEKTYRTRRWGKDLQIWMVEGRDFRSPNNMPDGPGKTIWGEEQKAWLFNSMEKSDASFKILISPTPIVGPDRGSKNDNHANEGFTWEGDQVREFLSTQDNAFVLCGDRHWQYATVHPETGVREFSSGAGSDMHAGGFKDSQRTEAHKFLRIDGGFLSVSVNRKGGTPQVTFTHYDIDGNPVNVETFASEK
jgi:alkaline phosphatase D